MASNKALELHIERQSVLSVLNAEGETKGNGTQAPTPEASTEPALSRQLDSEKPPSRYPRHFFEFPCGVSTLIFGRFNDQNETSSLSGVGHGPPLPKAANSCAYDYDCAFSHLKIYCTSTSKSVSIKTKKPVPATIIILHTFIA